MKNTLVSILIPFKNTEEFLPECINSILEQSYDNWEALAVNDHSTDDSYKLMFSYAEQDARIKVIQNKGSGIIHALRTAFEKSKGNLITRMDSDDIMTPNKLEIMVASLLKEGMGHIAIGQVKYFSKRGLNNGYKRYETWLNTLTQIGSNFTEIYKECVIPSPCWLVHKEDLLNCGAFSSNKYPEDYDLAFRFYERGLKCIPCNQILHHWRDYDTRTSRTSEHYSQNYFLDIKLHYFLKLDYNPNRPLVVWGAGNKGKTIAKELLKEEIDFHWLCDNPKKIGKDIYGKKMLHFSFIEKINSSQSIITVANEDEQTIIRDYYSNLNKNYDANCFFFC